MRHTLRPSATSQRGVGALVVVMVLFFIMSMVAAYASRNLIFEQKTSSNNYRATQAFEAADAGLEWAIAMLNGGRIDELCGNTTDVTKNTFRDRYLTTDVDDVVDVKGWGVNEDLLPTCVRDSTPPNPKWNCSCPSNSAPVTAAPVGTGSAPAFQIKFSKKTLIAGRPVIGVRSQSCSTIGDRCFGLNRESDALAEINALVGLAASVTQTPAAALTIRGNLIASNTQVSNDEGVVINAGGTIDPLTIVKGPAGSPPILRDRDHTLSDIVPAGGMTGGERMFLATFGMDPKTYRTQPAVVRLSCGAECTEALQDTADGHPGRVIWIDGDLNVSNGALTLGSVASPVILVVNGNINIGNGAVVTINGMVYSRGATWTNGGGTALVRGAFVAEGDAANFGNFDILGAATIVFDNEVVGRLKKVQARRVLDFGSMARVPGSWKDF